MNEPTTANWNYPTSVRFGNGRVRELPDALQLHGMRRPLLVTDAGLADSAMAQQALADCPTAMLFSGVTGNPTGEQVAAGLAHYRDAKCDGVIALGGGSALDAGKAIAFLSGQSRPIWDFEDIGDNWKRADPGGIAPCIAIPTTAGTGSEVGRASVITDRDAGLKKIIFHPQILPVLVIADPQLTIGLPPQFSGATGMDALSHNMEAYFAPGYHPLAQGIAVEGMRLVFDNLPGVMREPHNLHYRGNMLAASLAGATAFQKGLGAMHALAHPLGALYNAHHGTLNAVLMPYVLAANRSAIETSCRWLSQALQLETPGVAGLIKAVLELRRVTGMPHTLAELGIDDREADRIGEMALADPSAGGNPIPFTASRYAELFRHAVAGTLESD